MIQDYVHTCQCPFQLASRCRQHRQTSRKEAPGPGEWIVSKSSTKRSDWKNVECPTHLDDNRVGEVANPQGGHAVHIRGWPSECHPGCTCFFWKNDFSLERLQHTYDLDVLLLMKLSWPISCELRLTLEVKGDQRGRVKQSMILKHYCWENAPQRLVRHCRSNEVRRQRRKLSIATRPRRRSGLLLSSAWHRKQ